MRIAYFYRMTGDPDRVRTMAPQHAEYWRDLGLSGYVGGPFADRSGGLITFEAGSLEAAERASLPPIPSSGKSCWKVLW
jgi:hypothetical protein